MNTTNIFTTKLFDNTREIRITMKDEGELDFDALIKSNPHYILNEDIINYGKINLSVYDSINGKSTDDQLIEAVRRWMFVSGRQPLHDESIINGKREYSFKSISYMDDDVEYEARALITYISILINDDRAYGPLGIDEVLFIPYE